MHYLSSPLKFEDIKSNTSTNREADSWLQIHLYSTRAGECSRETFWNEEDGLMQPSKSGEIELGKVQQNTAEPVLLSAVIPAGSAG